MPSRFYPLISAFFRYHVGQDVGQNCPLKRIVGNRKTERSPSQGNAAINRAMLGERSIPDNINGDTNSVNTSDYQTGERDNLAPKPL